MSGFLISVLKVYKRHISPIFENLFGKACRFTPSCSQYTIEALEKFGFTKGISLGFKRFLKCHPWGGSGWDPIPMLNKQISK
jgi:putative membrane protein insertion efficiency factor